MRLLAPLDSMQSDTNYFFTCPANILNILPRAIKSSIIVNRRSKISAFSGVVCDCTMKPAKVLPRLITANVTPLFIINSPF